MVRDELGTNTATALVSLEEQQKVSPGDGPIGRGSVTILRFECLVLTILILVWWLLSPEGITSSDWQGLLLAATPLAIAAMAQTLPIVAGGQGLSAGATLVLVAAVIPSIPMSSPADTIIVIGMGLLIGLAVGGLNGVLIGYAGLRSTSVTLSTGAGAMAYALEHLENSYLPAPPALAALLYNATIANISIVPPLMLLAVCLAGERLLRSGLGAKLRARGADYYAGGARYGGWPVLFAYTVAGGGAGVGGVLLAGALGSVNVAFGAPVLLQILAATALGGGVPGLRGGSVAGSLLGAFIVVATGNLMVPLGIPDYFSTAIDATWLLLGFLLCLVAQRALVPTQVSFEVPKRARWALPLPVVLLLFHFRPEASDLATLIAGICLLGVGQAAVLRTGAVDLSMPGLISAVAITTVAMTGGLNANLATTLPMIASAAFAVGVIQGWIASRIGRAAMVVTLATAGFAQAWGSGLLVELPTGFAPPLLSSMTNTRWLGVSPAAWVMAALSIVLAFLLDSRMTRGSKRRTAVLGYIASALGSVVFGVFVASLGGSAHYSLADTYLLPAVAAALLAGNLLKRGGCHPIAFAIPVAILIVLVDTLLLSWGANYAERIWALMTLLILGESLHFLGVRRLATSTIRIAVGSEGTPGL
ncbi:ABC transporter permease subunit [Rhizobium lusitanum]|uniref:ABC transporter permease subunit n=1 Tax=Rhizobium lusitanum TaxID=293958 RepID=UPI00195959FB|nr:hypothetical protein [Rhizobium lusitanum]MBM7045572.1 hypothetical protein [Rhizobium lusitanum]